MVKEKSAPAGGGTPTGARQEMAAGMAHNSYANSTTNSAERQPFRVSDLLLHGAENGIFRRDLMNLTGYRDRELRLLIETERRQGCPILSDNVHGYFLPGNRRNVTAVSGPSVLERQRSRRRQMQSKGRCCRIDE